MSRAVYPANNARCTGPPSNAGGGLACAHDVTPESPPTHAHANAYALAVAVQRHAAPHTGHGPTDRCASRLADDDAIFRGDHAFLQAVDGSLAALHILNHKQSLRSLAVTEVCDVLPDAGAHERVGRLTDVQHVHGLQLEL